MGNLWKYSKPRFYILNTLWNYKFWLNCKKIYKTYTYYEETDVYEEANDGTSKMISKKNPKTAIRFMGYFYKDNIYLDNPGIKEIDKETWAAWKKKGLV